MSKTLTWIHIGDLHLDDADEWESLDRLDKIVTQINLYVKDKADFVFLPGDNANHGTADQYNRMIKALAPLALPWRIIPGDHDFEPKNLDAYEAAIPKLNRPEIEIIKDINKKI